MERTVTVGGRECKLKTSAALPRLYRQLFKKDIIIDMNNLFTQIGKGDGELEAEHYDIIEQIAYAMHKYGDDTQPDFNEWLESFRWAEVYDFLPIIVEMWVDEISELSTDKKKDEK